MEDPRDTLFIERVTPEMIAVAHNTGKISAIRMLRKATGCGLHEAKEAIEAALRDGKGAFVELYICIDSEGRWGHGMSPAEAEELYWMMHEDGGPGGGLRVVKLRTFVQAPVVETVREIDQSEVDVEGDG